MTGGLAKKTEPTVVQQQCVHRKVRWRLDLARIQPCLPVGRQDWLISAAEDTNTYIIGYHRLTGILATVLRYLFLRSRVLKKSESTDQPTGRIKIIASNPPQKKTRTAPKIPSDSNVDRHART